jgi:predicted NUDIX family NTP pyrophosphohydrolase
VVFYLIFGSGKEQAWNSPQGVTADDEDEVAAAIGRRELYQEPQSHSDKESRFGNSTQSSHSDVI